MIGHMAQELPKAGTNVICTSMNNRQVVQSWIDDKLASANDDALTDGNSNTKAWIINTASPTSQGWVTLRDWLVNSHKMSANNVQDYHYQGTSAFGEDPNTANGKMLVHYAARDGGNSGGTLSLFIEGNNDVWHSDIDCNGNFVQGTSNKGAACGAPSPDSQGGAPPPAPSCTYVAPEPPAINKAGCSCGTGFYPLTPIPGTQVPESQSCAYKTLPGTASTTDDSLPPASTNNDLCQICTQVNANEDNCSTMTSCMPKKAQATVQAGRSPVHVGTLTGSALSTSISSAISKLCPTPSKQGAATTCSTDTVKIGHIDYVEDGMLAQDGTLDVKVDASWYNETGLRKAMIDSAALTAMLATQTPKNCYTSKYDIESWGKRKRTPLALAHRFLGMDIRDHPHPIPINDGPTWCNTVGFAGVQYYNQFWRLQQTAGATDWIDASWSFHAGPGGDFACDFLGDLTDALIVVQPEFAVGDVELGEAIRVGCEKAMEHA